MVFTLSGIGVVSGSPHALRSTTSGTTACAAWSADPWCRPIRRAAVTPSTACLMVMGTLFAAGATTAALALGGILVAACALVTTANLCLLSETSAWLERRRELGEPDSIT